jgi:O-antigen/teichoic acid export membrane protein
MQRMVWLNAAQAILATLRGVGAVLVLVLVSPTITVFFIWQCLISLLSVILLASKTYRCLPSPDHQAAFSLDALRPTWRFAGGMLLTSILALALTQIDKILLSNLLPLEQFGYYTVASTAAAVVGLIAYPISQAAFPRLTELATSGNEELLIRTYHTVCQWISVLAIPPAMILAFFSAPVLCLWTQQSDLAQSAAPMLIPLAIGNLLNTFMIVPCVLQVAHGRAGLVARLNLVAVVVMVPIIFLLVPQYGAAAAAWIWVALNMGYVLLAIPLMHRDVIPSARARWYTDDVLKPLLIGILVSIGAFSVSSMNGTRVFEIVQLSIIVALATVLCGVSSSYPRASIYSFVRKFRKDTHA